MALYGSNDTDGITWDNSKISCGQKGHTFATVRDASAQSRIESVLTAAGVTDQGVWVAGSRSDDDTPKRIDGSTLPGNSTTNNMRYI